MHQLRAQAERMAINMPIQGTDSDLMKRAMIQVMAGLPQQSEQAVLLLQVHDELVLEVPDAEIKRIAAWVKETMESAEKFGVPIVVEAKAGKNWAELEKLS
ncbi:DNA polymerase I, partial [Patescibacteria group bacterium]|nr:DNA polymerase I [Patescibacteria group bacterium]